MQLIAATTTRSGLTAQAELDAAEYPKGGKISDQQMAALPLRATTSTATRTTPSGRMTTL